MINNKKAIGNSNRFVAQKTNHHIQNDSSPPKLVTVTGLLIREPGMDLRENPSFGAIPFQ
jgi:hypothetical protein